MEEYLATSEIVYPSPEVQAMGRPYGHLPEETSRLMESLYQQATKTSDQSEGGGSSIVSWIVIGVLVVGAIAVPFIGKRRKKH